MAFFKGAVWILPLLQGIRATNPNEQPQVTVLTTSITVPPQSTPAVDFVPTEIGGQIINQPGTTPSAIPGPLRPGFHTEILTTTITIPPGWSPVVHFSPARTIPPQETAPPGNVAPVSEHGAGNQSPVPSPPPGQQEVAPGQEVPSPPPVHPENGSRPPSNKPMPTMTWSSRARVSSTTAIADGRSTEAQIHIPEGTKHTPPSSSAASTSSSSTSLSSTSTTSYSSTSTTSKSSTSTTSTPSTSTTSTPSTSTTSTSSTSTTSTTSTSSLEPTTPTAGIYIAYALEGDESNWNIYQVDSGDTNKNLNHCNVRANTNWPASDDIKLSDVPFPEDHKFEMDSKLPGCLYTSSDSGGEFACLNFKSKCTTKFKGYGEKRPCGDDKNYVTKVLCQISPADTRPV